MPEFNPQTLDALRQPLESGETVIARANHRITYPSRMQLIAAMNPCRCGRAGSPGESCKQGPRCASAYAARISGPFLDRIDLKIEMTAVRASDLALPASGESSTVILQRVIGARARQTRRFQAAGLPDIRVNAYCPAALLEEDGASDSEARQFFNSAASQLQLSARGYYRALRVARTLADLDDEYCIRRLHVAEALSYRGEPMQQAA